MVATHKSQPGEYTRQFLAACAVFKTQLVFKLEEGSTDLFASTLRFAVMPLSIALDPDGIDAFACTMSDINGELGLYATEIALGHRASSAPHDLVLAPMGPSVNEHPGARIDFEVTSPEVCTAATLYAWLEARGYPLPADATVDDLRAQVAKLLLYPEDHPCRVRGPASLFLDRPRRSTRAS